MEQFKYVEAFLRLNGFKQTSLGFKTRDCRVVIENTHYEVHHKEDGTEIVIHSPNLQIYWLIGYLMLNSLVEWPFNFPKDPKP